MKENKKLSWVNPNDLEKIIKNCTNSVIDDLDLFDYEADKGNEQYKKGLLKTEFIPDLFCQHHVS